MARHYITQATHDRIAAEFFDLTTRGRHEVADKIERAREMGDLKENGDYHAAKDEQAIWKAAFANLKTFLKTTKFFRQVWKASLVKAPS